MSFAEILHRTVRVAGRPGPGTTESLPLEVDGLKREG